jgi:hypothetical protein
MGIQQSKADDSSSDATSGFVGGSMTRSQSIRKRLEENEDHQRRSSRDKSYLPRMNNSQGQSSGIVMPTMHANPHSNAGGAIESPQWGWYMNLTPPSPNYTNHPLQKKQNTTANTSQASTASISSYESSPKRPTTKPNLIFQKLPSQKHRPNYPSVPL